MNLRYLAAPLLALSLLPAQAQTSSTKQPTKQAYQAVRRDEEFLRLYEDVRNFETDNRKYDPDSKFVTLGRLSGERFRDRALKLAMRYGLKMSGDGMTVITCGNYLEAAAYDSGYFISIFDEFTAISNPWSARTDKITASITPRGFEIKEEVFDSRPSFGLPPMSKPDFDRVRRDLFAYDRGLREILGEIEALTPDDFDKLTVEQAIILSKQNSWDSKRYYCINNQTGSLMMRMIGQMKPRDEYVKWLSDFWGMSAIRNSITDIRSPRGSNKILIAGDKAEDVHTPERILERKTSLFTLSIYPDWTAELWVRNPEDIDYDTPLKPLARKYKIEFEK
ncbi:MAG: hypothetical protein HY517_00850 [Candidatus Aenigmarchaeota archaeon]|nr:hypothetical protein [Candidatus Aenigmarchaeota archaeon]